MKTIILAPVAAMSMSGVVVAQQAAATGGDTTLAGTGNPMGTSTAVQLKYAEMKEVNLIASKLIGINICKKSNEEVARSPTL